MEKILRLEETSGKIKEIPLRSTAASLIHYKSQFHRDGLADMTKLAEIDVDNLDGLDLEVFYNFLWCFAYSANKQIKPPLEFLEDIDITPIDFVTQSIETIVELLTSNAKTLKKK